MFIIIHDFGFYTFKRFENLATKDTRWREFKWKFEETPFFT